MFQVEPSQEIASEAKKQKREAKERMEDALHGEDDYLDLSLDEEKRYLEKYKKILGF
jgi:hypothetical protein